MRQSHTGSGAAPHRGEAAAKGPRQAGLGADRLLPAASLRRSFDGCEAGRMLPRCLPQPLALPAPERAVQSPRQRGRAASPTPARIGSARPGPDRLRSAPRSPRSSRAPQPARPTSPAAAIQDSFPTAGVSPPGGSLSLQMGFPAPFRVKSANTSTCPGRVSGPRDKTAWW